MWWGIYDTQPFCSSQSSYERGDKSRPGGFARILQEGYSVGYMRRSEGDDTELERYRYLSLGFRFVGRGFAVQAMEFTMGRNKEKVA